MGKKKKDHDAEIEDAVELIMSDIDEHRLSQSSVPKEVTRVFWRSLVDGLNLRLEALK